MSKQLSKIGIFPVLFIFALAAFGVKVADITSGVQLLNSGAVVAQEAPAEPAQEDSADDAPAQDAEENNLPVAGAYSDVSSAEEVEILMSLKQRREQIEEDRKALDIQMQLLLSTERRIDEKIARLEEVKGAIEKVLGEYDEREQKQMASVVSMYESMKAKDAAQIFQQLDTNIQLDIATRMKSRNMSSILAAMDPAKAKDLTTQLATYAEPPSIEEIESN